MTAVHLLNVSIHISQGTLLLCKEFLGMLDNGRNQEQGQRNDNQCHQSHLPADGQHHDKESDNLHNRGYHLCQRLAQGLLYRINIIGKA